MTDTTYTFALDGYAMSHGDCFLAQFSDTPCDGRMQKAHLLRAQTIRRELNTKVHKEDWRGDLASAVWDPRAWRPACYRHHTMLDQARTLRIPREAIPADTVEYARELGLLWWVDRTYRERELLS